MGLIEIVNEQAARIAELESELAALREQANSGLGKEIRTQEEWDALPGKSWLICYYKDDGEWCVAEKAEFLPPDEVNCCRYFLWTPPTLPAEPEVPSVPQFKGTVKRDDTGDVLFITHVSCNEQGCYLHGVTADGEGVGGVWGMHYAAYDHPDVPNQESLIRALEGNNVSSK